MRHFSIELLKESPSPALRTCAKLAQLQVNLITSLISYSAALGLEKLYPYGGGAKDGMIYLISNPIYSVFQPFVGRELFAAGFVSCWTQLNEACRRQLVRSLEMAFSSPNIPPEILATLLNLVYIERLLLSHFMFS